jgi:hypothetical protein
VISEDVLPKGIQIFALCREIGQNKILNFEYLLRDARRGTEELEGKSMEGS